MKQRTLTLLACFALASILMVGESFAQSVPSLVTQQTRMSTGGATPVYVQHRAITTVGAAPLTNGWYAWDQVPTAVVGTNYLLMLNDQNQVKRTNPFNLADTNFLLRVNNTGTNIEFVNPVIFTSLNGDVAGPNSNDTVNWGNTGISTRTIRAVNATATNDLDSIYVHINRGGTNSSAVPTAGAVAYGDGSRYHFTGVGTVNQVLISQAGAPPIWANATGLINAKNGLTVRADTVLLGGPLVENTSINTAGFNMNFVNGSATASTMNLGNGTNTFNININPGTTGIVNLTNIRVDTTAPNILVTDATGNLHLRSLASFIQVQADNALIATTVGNTTTISMGSPATGGAPLLTNRFISLSSHNINYEGTGNMNLGDATSNVTTNVHTGTTGNMTVQGTTLYNTAGANNIVYIDSTTHNVRSAPVQALTVNASPTMYLTKDATGNITQSVSPTSGFFRGQIAGTGVFQYTSPAINIAAGAAILVSVQNNTGIIGAIVVQVTTVTTGVAGTFQVETSENIQAGSFINYTVMNP